MVAKGSTPLADRSPPTAGSRTRVVTRIRPAPPSSPTSKSQRSAVACGTNETPATAPPCRTDEDDHHAGNRRGPDHLLCGPGYSTLALHQPHNPPTRATT